MDEMTLRDYFAAQAISGCMANTKERDTIGTDMEYEELVAALAYMVADAMMSVRGK